MIIFLVLGLYFLNSLHGVICIYFKPILLHSLLCLLLSWAWWYWPLARFPNDCPSMLWGWPLKSSLKWAVVRHVGCQTLLYNSMSLYKLISLWCLSCLWKPICLARLHWWDRSDLFSRHTLMWCMLTGSVWSVWCRSFWSVWCMSFWSVWCVDRIGLICLMYVVLICLMYVVLICLM